ncbi:MAG: outer membrane protein [Methylocystis sp.]|uniref:outer membrane protein n=1 Tax=Methylocystis sp. TaxID=1911079 RepID=UPI003DA295ED
MKKLLISVATLALAAGTALAADLPTRKAPPMLPPPPPPPPMWTGFYAGLNAGYGFGTNNNPQSAVWAQDAVIFQGFQRGAAQPNMDVAQRYYPVFGTLATGAGLAQSGSFNNANQNGFIGGGQIGYNYQWGPNFLIGIEADIQGTGIRGTSHGGASGISSVSNAGYNCFFNSCSPGTWTNTATSIGGTSINAGVDWMGTVRGRLGYLWTPTMLIYATGGLTYGGVYANVRHTGVTQLDNSFTTTPNYFNRDVINPSLTYTSIGGGNKSQTLVGWNVGGGLEWMFMPNWSIKAEGIYWNMGNMNVPTATLAAAPVSNALNSAGLGGIGAVRVNYQGVIARAGVNYHFNWGVPAPVVARY